MISPCRSCRLQAWEKENHVCRKCRARSDYIEAVEQGLDGVVELRVDPPINPPTPTLLPAARSPTYQRHEWTAKEDRYLRANYELRTNLELAEKLKRTGAQVAHRLSRLKLRRSREALCRNMARVSAQHEPRRNRKAEGKRNG